MTRRWTMWTEAHRWLLGSAAAAMMACGSGGGAASLPDAPVDAAEIETLADTPQPGDADADDPADAKADPGPPDVGPEATDVSPETDDSGGCVPGEELCNGLDDDCDAETDEGFSWLGLPCDSDDVDICADGHFVCSADGLDVICDEAVDLAKPELCNGVDDDCDAAIDEGYEVGAACGQGQCAGGVVLCAGDGSLSLCPTMPGGWDDQSGLETHDGLDNDCDGWTDEHAHVAQTVVDSLGGACPDGWTPTPGGACVDTVAAEVLVPEGTVWMGCDQDADPDCPDDEKPQHEVAVAAFAIGLHEVTASQYESCVAAGSCTNVTDDDCFWGETNVSKPGASDHPASCIDWFQARDYCLWLGQTSGPGTDLCSESQWEKAARGGCDLYGADCAAAMPLYVWGDAWVTELPEPVGNFSDATALAEGLWLDWVHMPDYDDGVGTSSPVGSYPAGQSPYGALDMAGNVWEWVRDCYHMNYEGAPQDGSPWDATTCTGVRVNRGAAFDATDALLRATERGGDLPTNTGFDVGLRCCRWL